MEELPDHYCGGGTTWDEDPSDSMLCWFVCLKCHEASEQFDTAAGEKIAKERWDMGNCFILWCYVYNSHIKL